MQTVAETWLILKLTGSGAAVGLTAALQFLPILLARRVGRRCSPTASPSGASS